jgi:hypothetical protein
VHEVLIDTPVNLDHVLARVVEVRHFLLLDDPGLVGLFFFANPRVHALRLVRVLVIFDGRLLQVHLHLQVLPVQLIQGLLVDHAKLCGLVRVVDGVLHIVG